MPKPNQKPEWTKPLVSRGLAAGTGDKPAGGRVDRDANVIYGYSVAELGEALGHGFRLDDQSLDQIVELGNADGKGRKSRFTHPNASGDALGTYLGRSFNFRRDGDRVRADLHIADAAFTSPKGDLGSYVLNMATEAPDDFGASVVIQHSLEDERDDDGKLKTDPETGKRLLPVARVQALHAVDVVDDPAANRKGFFADLSAAPDAAAQMATAYLDELFDDAQPDVIRERVEAYLSKYLANRFPDVPEKPATLAGRHLQAALNKQIDRRNDERGNRDSILADLAESAGLSLDSLRAVVDGDSPADAQPVAVLKSFATTLGTTFEPLLAASILDGGCYDIQVTEKTTVAENLPKSEAELNQIKADTIAGEQKRQSEIRSLCSMAFPDDQTKAGELADKYCANLSATPDMVRDHLFTALCAERKTPPPTQDGNGTDKPDADAALKAQYAANKQALSQLGVSEADFIASAKVSNGTADLVVGSDLQQDA